MTRQTERAAIVHDEPMSTGLGAPSTGSPIGSAPDAGPDPSGDAAAEATEAVTRDVAPSLDDPVANVASEALGGPLGRRAWRPPPGSARSVGIVARVLVVLTILTMG